MFHTRITCSHQDSSIKTIDLTSHSPHFSKLQKSQTLNLFCLLTVEHKKGRPRRIKRIKFWVIHIELGYLYENGFQEYLFVARFLPLVSHSRPLHHLFGCCKLFTPFSILTLLISISMHCMHVTLRLNTEKHKSTLNYNVITHIDTP